MKKKVKPRPNCHKPEGMRVAVNGVNIGLGRKARAKRKLMTSLCRAARVALLALMPILMLAGCADEKAKPNIASAPVQVDAGSLSDADLCAAVTDSANPELWRGDAALQNEARRRGICIPFLRTLSGLDICARVSDEARPEIWRGPASWQNEARRRGICEPVKAERRVKAQAACEDFWFKYVPPRYRLVLGAREAEPVAFELCYALPLSRRDVCEQLAKAEFEPTEKLTDLNTPRRAREIKSCQRNVEMTLALNQMPPILTGAYQAENEARAKRILDEGQGQGDGLAARLAMLTRARDMRLISDEQFERLRAFYESGVTPNEVLSGQ